MPSFTEEALTRGERAAWFVQRLFRKWTVLAVINLVAVVWLWVGSDNARNWWNFTWSALAVDVEFITALALVSMSRRDHDRLLRMERMERHMELMLEHLGIDAEE